MRRTLWRGGLLAGALALAILTLGAHAGNDQKVWNVTLLTQEDWAGSIANDVNASGLIGGAWVDEDAEVHPGFWEDGEFYDIVDTCGVPEGYEDGGGAVFTVNNKGLMAGSVWAGSDQIAVLWDSKKCTYESKHPDDEDLVASGLWGLNSEGDTCGFVVDTEGFWSPWLWPRKGKDERALSTGDYEEGQATAINAKGTVVGRVFTRGVAWHAALWTKKDELVVLHDDLTEADENIFQSVAYDIHEDGTVVGQAWAWTEDAWRSIGWTWTEKDGAELLPMGSATWAIAWRAVGNFVAGGVSGFRWEDEDAVVWEKGTLDVIPALEDFPIMEAAGVAADGTVVGVAWAEDDDYYLYPQAWVAVKEMKK
jgi:uncharacterized membrane protein